MAGTRASRITPRPRSKLGKARAGRVTAVTALMVTAVCGLTAALAGTGSVTRDTGPRPALVAPATVIQPGSLPVAEPRTGARWADHQLLVRIPAWTRAPAADCVPAPRPLPDTPSARAMPGGCGRPELAAAAPPGYTPAQLRAYLRLRGTGAGQTVAVVDAYDNPYAVRDLTIYSRQFGLPLPCPPAGSRPGCFRFSVARPYGFAGVDAGWALESDLDVQMVHAIAPRASIILVEAYDNSLISMFEALDYAARLHPAPAAISNSWGTPEFRGETAADGHCALARSLCVFSAGDAGNPGEYPAYDPYAFSVGGTTLGLAPGGGVRFETAWCCDQAAGGGGVSRYEPRPAYQERVDPYRGRGIPDVSFDADPVTGVPVHDTFGLNGQNGWFQAGGTSVGAPAWAGILADAGQLRAGAGRPPLAGAGFRAQWLIYDMPHGTGFGDITQGADNVFECTSPVRACRSRPGYDLVTGWGSPRPGIDASLASAS